VVTGTGGAGIPADMAVTIRSPGLKPSAGATAGRRNRRA